eukprot:TRINITY_DN47914_c0_g1_i1.p1 TRINITY_DN47914_c0_g1~~TRINITY_DN47914_c0_g1_i1.p1  ORF type:complete len:505 (+),score=53.16 TRINITY_DN47914_c0_g1_i1:60-1574(+)
MLDVVEQPPLHELDSQEFKALREMKPHVKLYDSCDPCDLNQGVLGDCWLISALATACEYPDFLKSLFEEEGNGRYSVKLFSYSRQQFVKVRVDDLVPYSGPKFISPTKYVQLSASDECWPCIIEKAFAVLAGRYLDLNRAHPVHAFGMLTGCQDLQLIEQRGGNGKWRAWRYKSQDDNPHRGQQNCFELLWQDRSLEELGEMIHEYSKASYWMCAGSRPDKDGDSHTTDAGIVSSHAYTILQVVRNPGGERGLSLIRMRNPWGNDGEWNGDWSDASTKWKEFPHVSRAVEHVKANNGMFWISLEDFVSEYNAINVVKYSSQWQSMNLAPDRLQEAVLYIFRRYDVNKDGLLSYDEFSAVMKTLDPEAWNDTKISKMWKEVDTSSDGQIQAKEFIEWTFASGILGDGPGRDVQGWRLVRNAEYPFYWKAEPGYNPYTHGYWYFYQEGETESDKVWCSEPLLAWQLYSGGSYAYFWMAEPGYDAKTNYWYYYQEGETPDDAKWYAG